jgi:hypothetical protein
MLFFARCLVALIELVPKGWQSTEFMRNVRILSNYYYFRGLVIAWHRSQLEKLDAEFYILQVNLKLVAAQREAHAKGIGPRDLHYPDIFDFCKDISDDFAREVGRVLAESRRAAGPGIK